MEEDIWDFIVWIASKNKNGWLTDTISLMKKFFENFEKNCKIEFWRRLKKSNWRNASDKSWSWGFIIFFFRKIMELITQVNRRTDLKRSFYEQDWPKNGLVELFAPVWKLEDFRVFYEKKTLGEIEMTLRCIGIFFHFFWKENQEKEILEIFFFSWIFFCVKKKFGLISKKTEQFFFLS